MNPNRPILSVVAALLLSTAPLTHAATATAVFAGGCFWCIEKDFEQLPGVVAVESGYTAGKTPNPTYEQVSNGHTGHTEAVRVTYDPAKVSYPQLVEYFWRHIDPTVKDRQFCDIGSQYRSAVFYADDAQRRVAESYIAQLDAAGVYNAPIATTLEPLQAFHEAEAYHQDYAARHPTQPYIVHVAAPKVEKLQRHFRDRLRNDRSDVT